ncbi:hypothetical protein [Saccharothrix luteola]|uniref:hypothetical protein n=1 Tax=Saccharothrix luteola TaxID=2893018 RepID=UPI001E36D3AF|nr:hypothetical protein [Saccharothrix luteola]MCC8247674.1 hypothetical protein [Saccharothrix luteola]
MADLVEPVAVARAAVREVAPPPSGATACFVPDPAVSAFRSRVRSTWRRSGPRAAESDGVFDTARLSIPFAVGADDHRVRRPPRKGAGTALPASTAALRV